MDHWSVYFLGTIELWMSGTVPDPGSLRAELVNLLYTRLVITGGSIHSGKTSEAFLFHEGDG